MSIKESLNQSTSSDLNYKDTQNLIEKIKYTKNLIITYRNHDEKGEIFVSSAYKEDLLTKENVKTILQEEIGKVFLQVLSDAGVFKRTEAGKKAFETFISFLTQHF